MKKVLIIFLFFYWTSYGQVEHAWIYFRDKPNVEEAISNPENILSAKAIQRKSRFNIPIDFRDVPVNENYISQVKSQEGISVKAKSKWFNCVHIIGDLSAIEKLRVLDFIDSIEFARDELNKNSNNYYSSKRKFGTTADFDYGFSSSQVTMLGTDKLHEDDFTGKNITVAVMDSGFPNVNSLEVFKRMRENGHLLGGYDFTNRSPNYSDSSLNNHGTLVLSTMAGSAPGYLIGTAPDADYYLFCTEVAATETPLEESFWVEAAERADSLGVDIINTSLSYAKFDDPGYDYFFEDMNGQTAFISKAANIATEKGILVCVSAGNSGESENFPGVGAPADANVITVGAVDSNRQYVAFSSVGPTADGRIKPDVMAQGYKVIVANEKNELREASGTSFSSPIMAGSIASLWQAIPEVSNLELMELVRKLSSNYQNPNNKIGYGIPDFSNYPEENIVENQHSDELYVFPNPVNSDLQIAHQKNELYQVTIYDLTGRLILQLENVDDRIDVSGFSKGIYIAKFENENTRKSLLIVKK